MSKTGVARGDQPQHPVRVVVKGVPPGPQAEEALHMFRAPLGQFHRAQQQRVRLSVEDVDVHKGHAVWPGARATYTNIHGQERLELKVSTETAEDIQRRVEPAYWQWCLVEIEFPEIGIGAIEMSAFLPHPIKGQTVFAHEDWGDSSDDKILRFADFLTSDKELGDRTDTTTQRASLLIDMRKFANDGGIEVDLYGYSVPITEMGLNPDYPNYEIVASSFWGHRHRGDHDDTMPTTVADVSGSLTGPVWVADETGISDSYAIRVEALGWSFPETSSYGFEASGTFSNGGSWDIGSVYNIAPHLGGWYSGDVAGEFYISPPTTDPNDLMGLFPAYEVTTTLWEGDNVRFPGTVKTVQVSGCRWWNADTGVEIWHDSNSAPTVDGQLWAELRDYIDYYVPEIEAYVDQEAVIKFVFFNGEAMDSYSPWRSAVDGERRTFSVWENSRTYPDRPGLTELRDRGTVPGQKVPTGSIPSSVAQHFGHQKFGTLKINPNQQSGGVSFEPA